MNVTTDYPFSRALLRVILILLILMLVWSAVPVFAQTPTSGGTSTLDSEEAALLTLIDNFRANNGAGALQASATLEAASQWMSNDLATANPNFSHTDSLGRGPGARLQSFGYTYSPWGENIAAGYADAQNTFNQWQTACDPDSSGTCTYAHRQNMLNPAFHAIGIGRAYSATSAYGWYWVTDFGGYLDQPLGSNPGSPSPSAPQITAFAATPASISAGQTSMLSWTISGAPTAITLDNGVGSVTGVTSKLVSPAQTTTYTITATNAAGSATAHVVLTVAPAYDKQPPATPVLISALANSASEVDLAWSASSDNAGVTGYQILRNGTVIGTVSGVVLSWSDLSVSGGNAYTYAVKAFDAAGNFSAASNSIVASTPLPISRSRSAPVILSFTANPTTLSAGQTSILSWNVSGASTISVSGISASISGLTSTSVAPTQTTTYVLTATNSQGSVTSSLTVNVSSSTRQRSETQPTTPTLISALAQSSGTVDLAWSPSIDNAGLRGYQIFRNGAVITTVAGGYVAWSDGTVSPGNTYTYAIRAFDAAGTYSGMSNTVQVTVPQTTGRESR